MHPSRPPGDPHSITTLLPFNPWVPSLPDNLPTNRYCGNCYSYEIPTQRLLQDHLFGCAKIASPTVDVRKMTTTMIATMMLPYGAKGIASEYAIKLCWFVESFAENCQKWVKHTMRLNACRNALETRIRINASKWAQRLGLQNTKQCSAITMPTRKIFQVTTHR